MSGYKDAVVTTVSTAVSLDPPEYGQTAGEIEQAVNNKPYDVVSAIIAWESGEMDDEDEVIEFFQHLIDTGLAWSLQGCYGRAAHDLIRMGRCHR